MSAKHTPGPWTADKVRETARFEIMGGNEIVGSLFASQSRSANEANARLIAAAPELLDALKHTADLIEAMGGTAHAARNAIAKAEGRT